MPSPTYITETEKVSAQQMNENFVHKLENGQIKEAELTGTAFVRMKLRQEAAVREIIPPVTISADEIDRDEDSDQPKVIVDKEPDSTATYVNFYGSGDRTVFKGPRYAIRFGKITSKVFRKSKFELMTYRSDIRKILADNSVKDMAEQEDTKFISTVDTLLTAAPSQVVPAAAFNSTGFVSLFQSMLNRKVPVGRMLMTDATYMNSLTLPATAVGDVVGSRHYDNGVEGDKKLWGVPVTTTIHNNIVTGHGGTASVYLFSTPPYLGNFFLLQDATLFIKQEAEMIEFYSYEAPGLGIGNSFSVGRLDIA